MIIISFSLFFYYRLYEYYEENHIQMLKTLIRQNMITNIPLNISHHYQYKTYLLDLRHKKVRILTKVITIKFSFKIKNNIGTNSVK